jgi:hypothetical protein
LGTTNVRGVKDVGAQLRHKQLINSEGLETVNYTLSPNLLTDVGRLLPAILQTMLEFHDEPVDVYD